MQTFHYGHPCSFMTTFFFFHNSFSFLFEWLAVPLTTNDFCLLCLLCLLSVCFVHFPTWLFLDSKCPINLIWQICFACTSISITDLWKRTFISVHNTRNPSNTSISSFHIWEICKSANNITNVDAIYNIFWQDLNKCLKCQFGPYNAK